MEPDFLTLWQEDHAFALPTPDLDSSCVFARKFAEWVRDLCALAKQEVSGVSIYEGSARVSVNQAKLLLVDKYFEWRSVVPKSHRNYRDTVKHCCIFQVFVQGYEDLQAIKLVLAPPVLHFPTPPPQLPPPPTPQIAGIFLGELDEPKR